MRIGHEWCGTVSAGGARRRSVLDRPPHHRGHHAGLRALPALPRRSAARLRGQVRDRNPGRLSRSAWPNNWPFRRRHCIRCRTRSTLSPGRWSSRAAMPFGRCGARILTRGTGSLVLGPGTIGLLVAMFASAQGAEVHLMGQTPAVLGFRPDTGFPRRLAVRRTACRCRGTRSSTAPTRRICPLSRSTWSSRASGWCTSGSPAHPAPSIPAPWS